MKYTTASLSDKKPSFLQTGVRQYFPKLGRYLQEDPIQDGLNWFIYCNNDPVNKIDPTGKWYFTYEYDYWGQYIIPYYWPTTIDEYNIWKSEHMRAARKRLLDCIGKKIKNAEGFIEGVITYAIIRALSSLKYGVPVIDGGLAFVSGPGFYPLDVTVSTTSTAFVCWEEFNDIKKAINEYKWF